MSRCLKHLGPGHQPVDQERAEQDRHAGAARHAERHGRHQRAALARIVGALRRDHPAHVALAKSLRRAFLGAHRVAVGEPVDHRPADARHGAERRTDPAAAQHQPPMGEAVLGAQPHAAARVVAHVARDRRARDREVAQLGQGKEPSTTAPAAGRPTDRGSRRSSAACRSADRCRSWRSGCRAGPPPCRAAARCRTTPRPSRCPAPRRRAARASRDRASSGAAPAASPPSGRRQRCRPASTTCRRR